MAWQFSGRDPETREHTALRIIAWSFFALAAYVSVESVRALLGSAEADPSTVGIVLAACRWRDAVPVVRATQSGP